jgi:hypothetical protein
MRPGDPKSDLGFILLKIREFFLTLSEIKDNVARA